MRCPFCRHLDSRVIDSRSGEGGTVTRRRRVCPECDQRFTTVETTMLMIVKRSGVIEQFCREKVIAGVRRACQGRPVSEDALARLGQRVEYALRALGRAHLPAHEVGLAVLGPLRELDEVAYLRFASVYRDFESLNDFETEIRRLRAEREVAPHDDGPSAEIELTPVTVNR
ncbi:MAG: transcriptional regulator NrdR [Pseudonocardiaceae bacterium]